MKRLLPVFVAAMLLAGCSCEWRMAQLERHCPDCFAHDTVHLDTTVVTRPVTLMERISLDQLAEPLHIERRDYTMDITLQGDTLVVEAETRSDTIPIYIEVPVDVPCPPPSKPTAWQWMAATLVALALILGIILALKHKPKENQ